MSDSSNGKPIDPIFAMRNVLEKYIATNKDIPFRNDICEKMLKDFIQEVLPPGQKKIYNKLKEEVPLNPRELYKKLLMGSKKTRVPIMQLAVKGLVEYWRSEDGFFIVKKNKVWSQKKW